jgi:hypothetical protein
MPLCDAADMVESCRGNTDASLIRCSPAHAVTAYWERKRLTLDDVATWIF